MQQVAPLRVESSAPRWVLSPDQADVRSAGGKACNLARLARAGARVPAWFCVGRAAFDAHLAPIRPQMERCLAELDVANGQALQQTAGQLQAWVRGLVLDPALLRELDRELRKLGGSDYAVRSSALAEDSAEDSFAGQLDTFLHVPADRVANKLRACWASAFAPGVLSYMAARGLDPAAQSVAVIVQAMVVAQSAGVLFTANPAGSLDELVVVSGLGLGEGVVADRVVCDHLEIQRETRQVRATIGHKSQRVVRAELGGTRVTEVADPEASRPALEARQVQQLVEQGLNLERELGQGLLDIEWAFSESGQLFFTQARPITTIPQGLCVVFDNSNIVEGYPGLTAPLTFSFIRRGYADLFRNLAREHGVPSENLEARRYVFEHLLGYLQGRVYLQLSNWYACLELIPGTRDYLPTWETMMGLPPGREAGPERLSQGGTRGLLKAALRTSKVFLQLEARCARLHRETSQLLQAFRARPLAEMDAHTLSGWYYRALHRITHGWTLTLYNDGYAFGFSGLTKALLARGGFPEADRLFNHLLSGDNRLDSVEVLRSVVALAERLRGAPGLREQVRVALGSESDLPLLVKLQRLPELQEFVAALQVHLELYGDRCLEELKLEVESHRTDPALLLNLIDGYVDSDVTVDGMLARERQLRDAADQQLQSGLRGQPLLRAALRPSLRLARRSVRFREAARLDRARMFGLVRDVFQELGRRLVSAGQLEKRQDVAFLTVDEVLGFVAGSAIDLRLRDLVERRQAEQARFRNLRPRNRFTTRGMVGLNTLAQQSSASPEQSGVLRGTGCAPGSVEAEVLVVTDPSKVGDVRGKVLVAEMTDPGWVFLMVNAAGLVSERGSLLSHTAIVGRELGIPTVVGVPDATTQLRGAGRVRLDGDAGTIEVLKGGRK